MESLDIWAIVRMACVFTHLLGFAAAAICMAFGDYAIFSGRAIKTRLLTCAAKGMLGALALLWLTGLLLVGMDTGFDPANILGKSKLLAKLTVVVALSLNGIALHHIAFPRLTARHQDIQAATFLPAVLGAVSAATWAFAAFLGTARSLTPVLNYVEFMGLYLATLLCALAIAVTFVWPRLQLQLIAQM